MMLITMLMLMLMIIIMMMTMMMIVIIIFLCAVLFTRECLSTACETMRRQITLRAFNGCKLTLIM